MSRHQRLLQADTQNKQRTHRTNHQTHHHDTRYTMVFRFFNINFNGYFTPIGGSSRVVAPNIVCHNAPFNRLGMGLGARCTAIKLQTPGNEVAVISAIPWGPEAQKMLELLGSSNVKYLIAPDFEHHMGIASWKKQFPNATTLGPQPLASKEGIDIQFDDAIGNTAISGDPLPADLASEFEAVYLPHHVNRELVLYHKPSKSMITADLLFNTPAYEQYKDSGMSATSGLNYLTRFFGFDCKTQSAFVSLLTNKSKSKPGLQAIANWPMDRIIMCHGEIIEGSNANERFAKEFLN